MAISKVIYKGETVIDISTDTVTPERVLKGITFHGSDGEPQTGTLDTEILEAWDGTGIIIISSNEYGETVTLSVFSEENNIYGTTVII